MARNMAPGDYKQSGSIIMVRSIIVRYNTVNAAGRHAKRKGGPVVQAERSSKKLGWFQSDTPMRNVALATTRGGVAD